MMRKGTSICLPPLTVVIPSRSAANLVPCIRAVQRHEPDAKIMVADDGVEWNEVRLIHPAIEAVQCIKKPFVYSRNCNLAIQQASKDDDIVLLNDDALLRTPGGFTAMQKLLLEYPEYGILSPVTNVVGNGNQLPQIGNAIRNEPRMLCFVCVLIPRRTLDLVGLLDERFVGYGYEDNDYCLRIMNAGLKLGIYDGCFVDHASLKSSYRGDGKPVDIGTNQRLYQEKWGVQ